MGGMKEIPVFNSFFLRAVPFFGSDYLVSRFG